MPFQNFRNVFGIPQVYFLGPGENPEAAVQRDVLRKRCSENMENTHAKVQEATKNTFQ